MRNTKKIASLCLLAVLILSSSLLAYTATSHTGVAAISSIETSHLEFTAAAIEAAPGDYITVPVRINNNPGIAGAEIWISLDHNRLEWDLRNGPYNHLSSGMNSWPFTVGNVMSMPAAPANHTVHFTDSSARFLFFALSGENVYEDGVLITLRLRVKENAAAGDAHITLSTPANGVYDQVFQNITPKFNHGKVTIVDPHASIPITALRIDALSITSVVRHTTYRFSLILNEGATGDNVIWELSDPSFAYVDHAGNVTVFDRIGNVRLTATDPVSGLSHSITLRIAS